ncbi:MAG: hypothetical protein WA134_04295 [Rhodoferax sp.]|uniref:hypothetical protein n=1 Tax=Rhodoferax sp. TaxID=50421 RepID=UPI003BB7A1C4
MNYATLALSNIVVWRKFSNQYRQSRINAVKPSMQEILSLMAEAAGVSRIRHCERNKAVHEDDVFSLQTKDKPRNIVRA